MGFEFESGASAEGLLRPRCKFGTEAAGSAESECISTSDSHPATADSELAVDMRRVECQCPDSELRLSDAVSASFL